VAYDPCGLLPDTAIPAGKPPLHPHPHAIHHVIGRIRHRVRPHLPHHAKPAHVQTNLDGCAGHATAGDARTTLLRTVSSGPALAAISGAGGAAIGGFGGFVTGRATRGHTHHGPHDGDGPTHVPEPSSILIFISAVLISLATRKYLARQMERKARGFAP
jgi:hypothetical protein